jgi:hypothetical protein
MTGPELTKSPQATTRSTSSPLRFTQPFLVLVEGADDQAVIAALVKYLNLDHFQIHDMGGNTDWTNKLSAIALDDSFKDNVWALGLIRDADQNPTGTWRSCRSAIINCNMIPPNRPGELSVGYPAICVSIVPSTNNPGAIEDVCLDSFNQDRMACVESYFACLDKARSRGSTRPKKSHVQTYLAGLIPPVKDLRIAAEKGNILNFSHSTYDELKEFLRLLHGASAKP